MKDCIPQTYVYLPFLFYIGNTGGFADFEAALKTQQPEESTATGLGELYSSMISL